MENDHNRVQESSSLTESRKSRQALLDDVQNGYNPTHVFANSGVSNIGLANDLLHSRLINSQFAAFHRSKGCDLRAMKVDTCAGFEIDYFTSCPRLNGHTNA